MDILKKKITCLCIPALIIKQIKKGETKNIHYILQYL